MFKEKITNKYIAVCGLISALYVVLSIATLPISSGAIQIRVAEGLTILPLFFSQAVVGVFVGCLLTNLISGCAIIDIFFGSLITLFSACLTYIIGKKIKGDNLKFILGGLFPVILNSFLLPLVWFIAYNMIEYAYLLQVLFLLAGELISVYCIGLIVFKTVIKNYKNIY